MRTSLLLVILVSASLFALLEDPPEIEWEVLYGSYFYDAMETVNGDIVVAGRRWYNYARTIFLYSTEATKIWESSVYPDNLVSRAVVETPDRGFVATGYGVPEAGSTHYSLSLYKISADGDALWSRLYMLPDGIRGDGYSLALLPDGGFAVCGRKNPLEGMDQAWILRADAQGDSLWTREWGWVYNDEAVDILYIDDGLTVFAQGRTPSTPVGPHLLRYDMDGNLLWVENFPEWPGTVTPGAQTMCEASNGGLLLMDNYWPTIMHTSYTGDPDWWFWPPGADQPYGYSLSTTMDGGILYGGEIRGEPDSKSVCGVIARFDSHGNELWNDFIYNSSCDIIYSAIQLSQGGYIAAGQANDQGYLIKYAPELGIEEPEPASVLRMDVSPNPCSSLLSVSFDLPEAGNASIRIFDLSGRLVSTVADGQFPAGINSVEWAVPEDMSSGCYLIQYNSANGTLTDTIALIK